MAKKSPSFSGNPALVGLGVAIRAARKAKNLSQEALAELADIDRSYMGGIESKRSLQPLIIPSFRITRIMHYYLPSL